jgi:hypothetical protein
MSIEEVECLIIGGSHDGTRYRVPSDITLWRIPRRGQASHHSVNYDPLQSIDVEKYRVERIALDSGEYIRVLISEHLSRDDAMRRLLAGYISRDGSD